MTENKSYGKITLGKGSEVERQVDALNGILIKYKEGRSVSLSETCEGFLLTIRNEHPTNRDARQDMFLTKESLYAMLNTIHYYTLAKGESISECIKNSLAETTEYNISDNLTNPFSNLAE